jgi:hypothetical protein
MRVAQDAALQRQRPGRPFPADDHDGRRPDDPRDLRAVDARTSRVSVLEYGHADAHAQLPGPYTVYLADCGGSCSSVNSASLKWFKIYELGLISGNWATGTWANSLLMKNL